MAGKVTSSAKPIRRTSAGRSTRGSKAMSGRCRKSARSPYKVTGRVPCPAKDAAKPSADAGNPADAGAKKALETEVAELVRFAASERYLDFRTRKLG